MEKPPFTEQQRLAIETTGRDLLVAASAGTGKTTVLAQRCLHLRLAKGVPLSSVLAVTFTDAAAADMRRKISDGLQAQLALHPNADLAREFWLIDRAPISTLHSFCFKLIREFAHELGLDPGLSILDADDAELLKSEVVEELVETWFDRNDAAGDRFRSMAAAYGGRDGELLTQELLRLHEFLQTLPDPNVWLAKIRTAYLADGGFLNLHWFPAYRRLWERELALWAKRADDAATLLEGIVNTEKHHQHIAAMRARLDEWSRAVSTATHAQDWTSFLQRVRENEWEKAPTIPKATERQNEVQELIKRIKKDIKTQGGRLAAQSPEEIVSGIRRLAPIIDSLLALHSDFERLYTDAKARQAVVDFNDLERQAFVLLTLHPRAAGEIRRRFRHILVDEYQDINPLQDAILTSLSRDNTGRLSELFFVGDEKQSIYGFRLAAPKLFLRKFNQYSPNIDADEVRIPLTHNFRCRREIIHAVNHIFERIASPALGNPYDVNARLVAGAEYPESSLIAEPIPVEIHLVDTDSFEATDAESMSNDEIEDSATVASSEASDIEREAALIARRINDFISSKTQVWNSNRTECQNVQYRDMVILLRTVRSRADAMSKVLRAHGIPVYTESTTGFFDAVEVRDILALLELLDNAKQDVALAAVLRSQLVGLSDDELARIRISYPSGRFHAAVWAYTKAGPDSRVRERLTEFRGWLDQWRVDATQIPLGQVIWDIYRKTNYLEYVHGLPGGDGRRANLVRLHDRARHFDQLQQRGLFRFLRFLRRLQDAEHDLGIEPVLSEADDVVRIISIHKSKGLEFPIVFVPDLAKSFNFRDASDSFLLHQDHLIGLDVVDLERTQRAPTLPKMIIADEKRMDVLAEEQRLLYVALTRARERLILSATANVAKLVPQWMLAIDSLADNRLAARRALDWLGPVFAGHPDTAPILGVSRPIQAVDDSRFSLVRHPAASIRACEASTETGSPHRATVDAILANLEVEAPTNGAIDGVVGDARSRLEWRYPFAHVGNVPGKISVTEWKRRRDAGDEEAVPAHFRFRPTIARQPHFLTDMVHRVTAAERGSATHAVLQRLDLARPCDAEDVQAQIQAMIERRFLSKALADAVPINAIVAFLTRPLGLALRRAQRVKRELPFSLLVPASELVVRAGNGMAPIPASEMVLVQGVIDCLFWHDDRPVLIDYKTDDVSDADVESAAASYQVQIGLYERAIRAIYGIQVRESHIVLLGPGRDVRMNNHDTFAP